MAWLLLEAIRECCDRTHGQATYLRLSTRPIDQAPFNAALERVGRAELRRQVVMGGYRLYDWRFGDQTVITRRGDGRPYQVMIC